MIYVLTKEDLMLKKGVIQSYHAYPKKGNDIIFKKDIITIWEMNGNKVDFEYEELDTEQALNTIDKWQQ